MQRSGTALKHNLLSLTGGGFICGCSLNVINIPPQPRNGGDVGTFYSGDRKNILLMHVNLCKSTTLLANKTLSCLLGTFKKVCMKVIAAFSCDSLENHTQTASQS